MRTDLSKIPLDVVMGDIPEKKIKQLQKKGFETVDDLLRFFPSRYEIREAAIEDFKELSLKCGENATVAGVIVDVHLNFAKSFLTIKLHDIHQKSVTVTWFHQNYLADKFRKGDFIKVYGKISFSAEYGYNITSPISYGSPDSPDTPLPIYRKVPGMSNEYLVSCINECLRFAKMSNAIDYISTSLQRDLGIDDYVTFLEKTHNPQNKYDLVAVEKRKCAETLLPFVIKMTKREMENQTTSDKVVPSATANDALSKFHKTLPFEFTADQEKTINEISVAISSGKRVDALVQGDVGCGKTMVAAATAAIMAAGGYQTVVMAPTTVLAAQHYQEFKGRFEPFGCSVIFLGGKEKAKEKKEALQKIKDGTAKIVVGTHSVFSDCVEFNNLGLTVVDEEHRFGVKQREKLREKAKEGAHCISMSATPIPRTLALSIYGDSVSVYNIRTMPAGRKPVITQPFSNEEKVYEGLYRQIKQGHQCYVVCPLITANDSEKMADVDSLEETEKKIRDYFRSRPEVRIAVINGKMKAEAIQSTISDFAKHEYDILLSTTIVEVGVNVPNATVMVIKNAERFGLAQLHQLRGRVGRGSAQSYCVLLSEYRDRPRLQIMARTNDGFEIAQEDLALRGTGNLVGTAQSGVDEAVTNMIRHPKFYEKIKETVRHEMDQSVSGCNEMVELAEAYGNIEGKEE